MSERNQDEYNHFYDDQKRKKRKGGYFFSSLIGAMIGALSIILFLQFSNNGSNSHVPIKDSNTRMENQSQTIEQISYEVDTSVTKAVEKVFDAVVGITNLQGGSFWSQAQEAGTGSGVVYKKQGDSAYIVTNHHVIEGANQIEVTLSDGTKVDGGITWQ